MKNEIVQPVRKTKIACRKVGGADLNMATLNPKMSSVKCIFLCNTERKQ